MQGTARFPASGNCASAAALRDGRRRAGNRHSGVRELRGGALSTGPALTFESGERGEYWILLTVGNSAGEDRAELRIDVYETMPPEVSLPGASRGFSVLQDSLLVLAPEVSSALPVAYSWTVDGEEVSADSVYTFPTGETGSGRGGIYRGGAQSGGGIFLDI